MSASVETIRANLEGATEAELEAAKSNGVLIDILPPMPTAPPNSADALWAMRACGERYNHPEFREHLGKFVAVYGFRIILSGDDPLEVRRKAAEVCGVSEKLIAIDYWDE